MVVTKDIRKIKLMVTHLWRMYEGGYLGEGGLVEGLLKLGLRKVRYKPQFEGIHLYFGDDGQHITIPYEQKLVPYFYHYLHRNCEIHGGKGYSTKHYSKAIREAAKEIESDGNALKKFAIVRVPYERYGDFSRLLEKGAKLLGEGRGEDHLIALIEGNVASELEVIAEGFMP